ncbi:MAG: bacillithiol biosynthesis BshC, partial [Leeuwenhoekiella sp.]
FIGAVKAQEVKQLKGLDHLEKRLLKAQKRKLSDEVKRLTALQLQLFPQENLQERIKNFSEFYLEYGDDLIPRLMESLEPKNKEFTVIVF